MPHIPVYLDSVCLFVCLFIYFNLFYILFYFIYFYFKLLHLHSFFLPASFNVRVPDALQKNKLLSIHIYIAYLSYLQLCEASRTFWDIYPYTTKVPQAY